MLVVFSGCYYVLNSRAGVVDESGNFLGSIFLGGIFSFLVDTALHQPTTSVTGQVC